jgi:hypothetical protein
VTHRDDKNTNYVRVGTVSLDPTNGRTALGEPQTIYVGVRADEGRVVTSMSGGHNPPVPLLTGREAGELGALLTKASAVLPKIVAAQQEYRDVVDGALRGFENTVNIIKETA